jgi:hypothetical protein
MPGGFEANGGWSYSGGVLALSPGPNGFYVESEGAGGIAAQVVVDEPGATRVRLHHPGSDSIAPTDLIFGLYEFGFAISMAGSGTLQFSVPQVGINGTGFPATPGNFVVSDGGDLGALFLTAVTGDAHWAGESYGDISVQRFGAPLHKGSLRLRVINTPRTVADAVTVAGSGNNFTSATAAFVASDQGRRVSGPALAAGNFIAAVINATTATLSGVSTTANPTTITIGTEAVEDWTGNAGTLTKQMASGALGPAGQPGIVFGALEDTNLYRAGVGVLATDGALIIGTRPAFAAGDKYLIVDATGHVHVSGLGPAS